MKGAVGAPKVNGSGYSGATSHYRELRARGAPARRPCGRPGRSTRFGPVPAGHELRRRNRFLLRSRPAPWGCPWSWPSKAPAGAATWEGPGTAGVCAVRNPPLPLNATGAGRSVNRAVTCRFVCRCRSGRGRGWKCFRSVRWMTGRIRRQVVRRGGRRWHRVPGRPVPSGGRQDRCRCPAPAAAGCGRAGRCSTTARARRPPGP